MKQRTVLLLATASLITTAAAGRGTVPSDPPMQCAPRTEFAPEAPFCVYGASPSGAGLNPDCKDSDGKVLGSSGWCTCGDARYLPDLTGSNPCPYTTIDGLQKIDISKCTITNVGVVTVTPQPVGAKSKRGDTFRTRSRRTRSASFLQKRDGDVTYDESCNDPLPAGSPYPKDKFPTMKSVLQAAYSDAMTLATFAHDHAAANRNAIGLTNFFDTTIDGQYNNFLKMMKSITTGPKTFSARFVCKDTLKSCDRDSAMVTDATASANENEFKDIIVCPIYWKSMGTTYLIPKDADSIKQERPYRDLGDGAESWCWLARNRGPRVSKEKANYFATAGHTIIHELTHLDSLAKHVGLEEGDDRQHGTVDASGKCELNGAYTFFQRWKKKTDSLSPDYNAENYAAAATELWFFDKCRLDEIQHPLS